MAIVMGRLKNRKRCIKKGFEGIHDRFQNDSTFRELLLSIDRTEEVCIQMDKDAQKDFTYRMTDDEYFRYTKNWWISFNKSGKIGPMRDRSDFNEALTTLNRPHQESGEERLAPIPYWQNQTWHPSSSSSSTSWWQWNDSWWSSWQLTPSQTASELMKEQHIERGDPLCRFFQTRSEARLCIFFYNRRECEQHTSRHIFSLFHIDLHAHAWLKPVWRAHITFHESSSCAHVFVLTLRDFSTFLSLLSIFSLIILSFFLPINFIFHDVVPCALQLMRTLAPLPSTTLTQIFMV